MLQACVVTSRGCLPYPVSEDAAFPPDVPELWGEEQRGSQSRSPPRVAGAGEAWTLGHPGARVGGQCVAVSREGLWAPPGHYTPNESRDDSLKLGILSRSAAAAERDDTPTLSGRTHGPVPLPGQRETRGPVRGLTLMFVS